MPYLSNLDFTLYLFVSSVLPMLLFRKTLFILTFFQSFALASPYWKHQELQGNVGSCHTFATVALIEAEYWKTTGKYINLSERDLFVRHFIGTAKNSSELLSFHLHKALQQKLPDTFQEMGHMEDDFKLASRYGITSEKELSYKPMFKNGVSLSVERLRHERNTLSTSAEALRAIDALTQDETNALLKKHFNNLNDSSIRQMFTPPKATSTSAHFKQWLAQYSLNKLTPKTTQLAKSKIIQMVTTQPVAVDITNFKELIAGKYASVLHKKHSVVVFAYNAKNDTFSVRSSTHKRPIQVSADALSRGTYRLYYLSKK